MPPRKGKPKLQWRRYKLGTAGIALVSVIGALLVYIGILSYPQTIAYVFLAFGALLIIGVGFDLYRMYGY